MKMDLTLSLPSGNIVVPVDEVEIEEGINDNFVQYREIKVKANREAYWNDGTPVSK